MARPQKENGHTEVANELLDAIVKLRLNSYEHSVLWAIIRKTYGWNKKTDHISYTQFEEVTGINRRHIAVTLNQLNKRHIITILKENYFIEYGIQKDYEKWDTDPLYRRKKRKLVMDGYIYLYIGDNNPYRLMANQGGYIAKHRLVMARHLGRLLDPLEVIHHINHRRDDNHIENLQIVTNSENAKETLTWLKNNPLRGEVTETTALRGDVISASNKALPLPGESLRGEVTESLRGEVTTKDNKDIIQKTVIPDWLDKVTWLAFLEMRAKKKATPTEHAKELIIRKLTQWKEQGQDPNKILEQSIMNNWTDIYQLKNQVSKADRVLR